VRKGTRTDGNDRAINLLCIAATGRSYVAVRTGQVINHVIGRQPAGKQDTIALAATVQRDIPGDIQHEGRTCGSTNRDVIPVETDA
jgi:hypothetical protein